MYSVDQEVIEEKKKPVEVDLHPITKGVRTLVFLGDLILTFITAFIYFNAFVYPIASGIVKYNEQESIEASYKRDEILYKNKILYYKDDIAPKYNINDNIKYTFNRFLAYYTFEDGVMPNPDMPEYAHLPENEVLHTYYVDIKHDEKTYINLFSQTSEYFNVVEGNITLKDEVKESVKYFFDPVEKTESETYKKLSKTFANMYGTIMKDIKKNDLTFTGSGGTTSSYLAQQAIVDKNYKVFTWRMSISVLIAHVLAFLTMFVGYPLFSKHRRTPMMSIFRLDRISIKTLKNQGKLETVITNLSSLALTMGYMFLLPLSYTDFFAVIDLPLIVPFCIVAAVVALVGLVVLLITGFNQTLTDFLSRSVIVPLADLEAVERAKTMKNDETK